MNSYFSRLNGDFFEQCAITSHGLVILRRERGSEREESLDFVIFKLQIFRSNNDFFSFEQYAGVSQSHELVIFQYEKGSEGKVNSKVQIPGSLEWRFFSFNFTN